MSAHGQCNNVTYMLQEGSSEWQACKLMPTQRYAAKAFASNDEIFVLGGRILMNPSNAVESFHTASHCWEKLPGILTNRMFSAMVEKDDCIYVIGGLTTTGEFVGYVEMFDIEKKRWINAAPLQSKRADMSAGKWSHVASGIYHLANHHLSIRNMLGSLDITA